MSLRTIADFRRYLRFHEISGNFTWAVDRRGVRAGDLAGTIDKRGYRVIQVCGRIYKAHRVVWLFHFGEWPPAMIDHMNGIKDDNRLANLRLATSSQNSANRLPMRLGLPKGVHAHGRLFRAEIKKDGAKYRLGSFETVQAAAAAYEAAARSMFGEFARAI